MSDTLRLGELRNAVADGRELLAVHYACESLMEAKDRPAAIACIGVANLREGTREAFSQADIPPPATPEAREIALIERFFAYMTAHREALIVHWNMNTSTYGFAAIANRYRYLNGNDAPYKPSEHLLYDLDDIIGGLYGDVYVKHPKLYNLASLNQISLHSFLKGADEVERFKANDLGALSLSTLTKTRVILDILNALIDGRLRTQHSAGSVQFAGTLVDAVSAILAIGQRMRDIEREFGRRHDSRPTIKVNDEYDAQDLLKGLLTLFFDDVRPESVAPSYAGGSSRIDFLIPAFELAIEVKHSRASMTAKKLADELIIDRDRYKADARVKHLICLVFDYEGILPGVRGLENDLIQEATTEGLAVTVKIFDR